MYRRSFVGAVRTWVKLGLVLAVLHSTINVTDAGLVIGFELKPLR